MPTFAYKARNQTGDVVGGTLIAETPAAAARILDERALVPVHVDEVKAAGRSFLTGGTRRIGISKIGVIYEQLADLLKSGVPMLRALDVLAKQASNPSISRVLRELRDDIAGGDALADAMEKHPHAFPNLHVTTVRAGEAGGFLEDVLARLSDFVERQDELRNKFIGAMIYPCILLLGGLGAVVFLMIYVVPNIRPVLSGQQLPLPTIIVFGLSDAFSQHYLMLAGVIVLIVAGVVGFFQSGAGRVLWAKLQLSAPLVGKIYTMISLCRFCRILGTMLANGIPILQALRIAKDSTGNSVLAESIDRAAESVRSGDSLATPLSASRIFPPAVLDMIAVAEESNTLDKVLVDVADTQEARTARQIDLAMRLLEPAMLVVMAGIVMFIAVALLLPILKMATSGFKG
ncbi:MAG: Type II secretion system protein F [Phycisphaerae bacterium]|nr:Type II secretion system protein F [Phycisphaerae bacterium]